MKKNRNLDKRYAFLQLCLCIFVATFPIYLAREQILLTNLFNQSLIVFFWVCGSIPIYIILGSLFKKYYQENYKQ
jgi:hypothetical protein